MMKQLSRVANSMGNRLCAYIQVLAKPRRCVVRPLHSDGIFCSSYEALRVIGVKVNVTPVIVKTDYT